MFTLIAIFTLALGIGANTAIFSVVRGVLLKPLPFDDADRLVGVWHTAPGIGIPELNMSPSNYFIYREEGRVFEDVGLWNGGAVSITGSGEPERVQALFVTDGTLSLLHVNPIIGRHFTPDDDSPKTPERVLLSHAYWERKFGSDPAVVGKSVVVDGKPREIIGVLPAGFRFLDRNPQLVLPFRFNRAELSRRELQLSRCRPSEAWHDTGAGERGCGPPPPGNPGSISDASRLHAEDVRRCEAGT